MYTHDQHQLLQYHILFYNLYRIWGFMNTHVGMEGSMEYITSTTQCLFCRTPIALDTYTCFSDFHLFLFTIFSCGSTINFFQDNQANGRMENRKILVHAFHTIEKNFHSFHSRREKCEHVFRKELHWKCKKINFSLKEFSERLKID